MPYEAVVYEEPVEANVTDWFRRPATDFGAGNRGWEYATTLGQPVTAVAAGVVAFAGPVAGRGVISIEHRDGIRSSLTGMQIIRVTAGDTVARGELIGTASRRLHLGFRRGGIYLDPADVLSVNLHAVLVEIPQ